MATSPSNPDPEVPAKATRRRFTEAKRTRILAAYDAASDAEKSAICRRERVYSSLLSSWRTRLKTGNVVDVRRGPKPNLEKTEAKRIEDLERQLAKAQRVIDIQGKVYALLRACAGESADQMDLPPWQKPSEK